MPISSILVGVDFSAGSKAALLQAAQLARTHEAKLHVLHVIASPAVAELSDVTGTLEAELRKQALSEAQGLLESACIEAEVPAIAGLEVKVGVPFQEILRSLEMTRSDLLILGSTGTYGDGTGGLSQRCTRKAPVDVLLIDPQRHQPLRKVAAFVDFSSMTGRVLERAALLAGGADATLHVVHVYEGPRFQLDVTPKAQISGPQRERWIARRREQLDECLGSLAAPRDNLHVACQVVENASASRAITQFVADNEVDLVVLGVRGRTEFSHILLGSVAARILTRMPTAVLTVKPSGLVVPRYE